MTTPKTRNRAALAVVSVALAGTAAIALARAPHPPAAAANDERTSPELARMENRVAELETALASHGARIDSVEAASRAPSAPAPAPTSRALRPPPDPSAASREASPTAEELRELEAQRMRQFDDILTNEPRDAPWANRFEGVLRDAVQAASSDSNLDSVSCRTSLCRLEVSAGSQRSADTFLAGLRGHLPPMAGAHWSIDQAGDGSTKTTVDIVREGHSMPSPVD